MAREPTRAGQAPFKYRVFRKGRGKRSGKTPPSATMRKTQETHQEQENGDVLPGSIIAMVTGSVKGVCPFEQTASVGAGALERRDRADRSSRDHADQCSAGAGVGTRGTSGVSTLARVVSGGDPQKRETAPGPGGDLLLRPLVALDREAVGAREAAAGASA